MARERESADSCLSLSMLEIIFLQDYLYKRRDLVIDLPQSERPISSRERKKKKIRSLAVDVSQAHGRILKVTFSFVQQVSRAPASPVGNADAATRCSVICADT